MEIASKYNPVEVEKKWYQYWMEHRLFHSEPDDREPFTIVIPPPNVTGVLHMGHMLNNTIQDVLVRRARMQGKNACWVPGNSSGKKSKENRGRSTFFIRLFYFFIALSLLVPCLFYGNGTYSLIITVGHVEDFLLLVIANAGRLTETGGFTRFPINPAPYLSIDAHRSL
jgi:hypothetical protein